ncbi:type II secretion system protein [Chitinimonas naiadis]
MRHQTGFSYFVALFVVAIASIVALRAVQNSATAERRAREADLLYVGQAYQEAIRQYYELSPGSGKRYPPNMEALLRDSDTTRTRRYLRRVYRDPITGSPTWGEVPALDATGKVVGIKGVYSLSTQQPIKVDGFPAALASFTGAKRYMDWQFVYQPN